MLYYLGEACACGLLSFDRTKAVSTEVFLCNNCICIESARFYSHKGASHLSGDRSCLPSTQVNAAAFGARLALS